MRILLESAPGDRPHVKRCTEKRKKKQYGVIQNTYSRTEVAKYTLLDGDIRRHLKR